MEPEIVICRGDNRLHLAPKKRDVCVSVSVFTFCLQRWHDRPTEASEFCTECLEKFKLGRSEHHHAETNHKLE